MNVHDLRRPRLEPPRRPHPRLRLRHLRPAEVGTTVTACLGKHDEPHPADIGYLCFDHYGRLRSSLTELPAIATWLAVNLASGGNVLAQRVTGSTEDPMPLRVDILDLIGPVAPDPDLARIPEWEASYQAGRDVPELTDQRGEAHFYDEVRSYARLVEEESGDDWDDTRTLTGAVTYLTAHLTWIADQPWVDEFAGKIDDLRRSAHRIAPWRPQRILEQEPCTGCNIRAVVWHVADGLTRCEKRAGGCGRVEHLTKHETDSRLPRARSAR